MVLKISNISSFSIFLVLEVQLMVELLMPTKKY
jgi:hypothetical protein